MFKQNESLNEPSRTRQNRLGPRDSTPMVDQDGMQKKKDEETMILNAPKQLTDDDRMPFGKHAGERMADVPVGYLHWLWTKTAIDHKSPVGEYIERNLSALETEDPDLIWK